MGKCFPGLWNVYIHTWRKRETEPQLCYVGGEKLAGDTQNVKGVFLQSGIIGIFIFPPFLILNQTLNSIYYTFVIRKRWTLFWNLFH